MLKKKDIRVKNLKNQKFPIKEDKVVRMQKFLKFKTKYKHLISVENRGKPLTIEEKVLIIRIYINYKLKSENFDKPIEILLAEVAELCGITSRTLRNIKIQFDVDVDLQDNKNIIKNEEIEDMEKNYILSDDFREIITNFIKERADFGKPTLTTHIIEYLGENYNINVSKT